MHRTALMSRAGLRHASTSSQIVLVSGYMVCKVLADGGRRVRAYCQRRRRLERTGRDAKAE
jgi:hypothetical protein